MTKSEALQLVRQHVKNENLVKHMIAAGAVMRALARKFGGDEDKWELAGILHDMDWEETADDFKMHSVKAKEYLQEAGVDADIINAVYVHNHIHGLEPVTMMEKALYCSEELTGLIVACALVVPSKKLADVKVKSILKKFKQPSFAAGVDRDLIQQCQEKLKMSLEELVELELKAMQAIAEELGL